MSELTIRNRQRLMAINTRWLRKIVIILLEEIAGISRYELAVHAVNRKEITRLNETFLQHSGATDVIAFDHKTTDSFAVLENMNAGEKAEIVPTNSLPDTLYGELFICVEVASEQARQYRTTWSGEFVRYIIHGLLHLEGYDDHSPGHRREMKKEEDRRLNQLRRRCDFEDLIRKRGAS